MTYNQGLLPHYQRPDPKTSIPNRLADHLPCKKMNTPSPLEGALDEALEELLEFKKG